MRLGLQLVVGLTVISGTGGMGTLVMDHCESIDLTGYLLFDYAKFHL